ncbi:MAG: SIMPL domain-containing protein [Pseudomonadota bacterium]|nr:SIMPL domain-containing protein [Pseudomonadota bacterium]
MKTGWGTGLAMTAALGVGSSVLAQTLPPPRDVVSLSASASVEVTQDWFTVVFSTTREGSDAAAVQAQLKQALNAALLEAKKAAQPGQVEVRTGSFSIYPRYAPPAQRSNGTNTAPGIVGWQGSTELIVEGRDTETIGKLTGRIQGLSIARVGFSLSREARQKVEGDATAAAITRFRASAEAVSRQFGFGNYALREVAVNTDGGGGRPMPMMRMQASAAKMEDGLPAEAGKEAVTATVNGSVQMSR